LFCPNFIEAAARLTSKAAPHYSGSTSLAIPKMLAKEPDDAGVELTVKGRPVEARRLVGANAWYGRRELRRTRRQERIVAGWHDMNVRFAR